MANAPALKFKITKNVTLPLFKIAKNSTRYFKLTSAMFIGKEIKDAPGATKKEPATLCHCVDLETGEEGQFIVATVLKGELGSSYPDDSYVGKSFRFSFTRPEGKAYNLVTIAEIEVESDAGEEKAPAEVKPAKVTK